MAKVTKTSSIGTDMGQHVGPTATERAAELAADDAKYAAKRTLRKDEFKCHSCESKGKTTIVRMTDAYKREVGIGLDLCRDCFDEAGRENEHHDGYHEDGCPTDCPYAKEAARVNAEIDADEADLVKRTRKQTTPVIDSANAYGQPGDTHHRVDVGSCACGKFCHTFGRGDDRKLAGHIAREQGKPDATPREWYVTRIERVHVPAATSRDEALDMARSLGGVIVKVTATQAK